MNKDECLTSMCMRARARFETGLGSSRLHCRSTRRLIWRKYKTRGAYAARFFILILRSGPTVLQSTTVYHTLSTLDGGHTQTAPSFLCCAPQFTPDAPIECKQPLGNAFILGYSARRSRTTRDGAPKHNVAQTFGRVHIFFRARRGQCQAAAPN